MLRLNLALDRLAPAPSHDRRAPRCVALTRAPAGGACAAALRRSSLLLVVVASRDAAARSARSLTVGTVALAAAAAGAGAPATAGALGSSGAVARRADVQLPLHRAVPLVPHRAAESVAAFAVYVFWSRSCSRARERLARAPSAAAARRARGHGAAAGRCGRPGPERRRRGRRCGGGSGPSVVESVSRGAGPAGEGGAATSRPRRADAGTTRSASAGSSGAAPVARPTVVGRCAATRALVALPISEGGPRARAASWPTPAPASSTASPWRSSSRSRRGGAGGDPRRCGRGGARGRRWRRPTGCARRSSRRSRTTCARR